MPRCLLKVDFAQRFTVGVEPLNGFFETFVQGMTGLKSELFFSPADIQAPSRLPVGLGRIPCDLSCKAGFRRDHGGKIADGDFFPCSQVDGQTSIIVFCGEQDANRSVLHV